MNKIIEGRLIAPNLNGKKIAILVTRFNSFITEHLLSGATDALLRHGVKAQDLQIIKVPGAFELPLLAKKVAISNQYLAIVALGAVIRGGTPHFEYVAGECTKGLAQVALDAQIPVTFGVLTVDNIEQAIERSGTKAGNKGAEAALTALEMINLLQTL